MSGPAPASDPTGKAFAREVAATHALALAWCRNRLVPPIAVRAETKPPGADTDARRADPGVR